MIYWLSHQLIRLMSRRGMINDADTDIYIYGANQVMYTVLSTIGLFFVGIIWGRLFETVLITAVYYTNQTIGGGFHSKTHIRCFVTMLIGLELALLSYLIPFVVWIEYTIPVIALLVLYSFPLVLHPNKQYLEDLMESFIRRSRIVVVCEGFIVFLLMQLELNLIAHACCLGLSLSALSRVAGFSSTKSTT